MNRQLLNKRRRRWARRGGGYAQADSLVPIPASDWTFGVKDQVTTPYSDCGITMRPGQLVNQPNPDLAQAVMAGGRRTRHSRYSRHSRNSRNSRRTPHTHRSRKQKQRGGACGCMQRGGGVNGFSVNVGNTIGGTGPNVAPVYAGVPCNTGASGSDPRAPADLYSMTPNVQRGGAYDASCYRAPGSELPVYNAETAGFRFEPSTASGAALPDGVTAYNTVVPYAARLGGARRSRRNSRKHSRKASKKSYRRRN